MSRPQPMPATLAMQTSESQATISELTDADRARMEALIKDSRLSIPPLVRIPMATSLAFVVGMGLGTAHGSKMAGLRFRAEHAHKLPNTPTGWFLYHKTKNYHVATGGVFEGLKMGTKLSIIATSTFAIENMFDTYRGTKDFLNTVIACVTVAGGFSLWNRFSLPTTARTTKSALIVGLAYGGLQDMIGIVRGRKIGYVEYLNKKRKRIFKSDATTAAPTAEKP